MPKKNIMISTIGGSPKTVTEMYQALKFKDIAIDEIHLVGTAGSDTVPEQYRPELVAWKEYRSLASDIRSRKDAEEVGDLIFKVLKTIKERDDVARVFMDLTGGRKEMSSYLMVSAQLLCADQDELYHVEINDLKGPLYNRDHDLYDSYYYPQHIDEITLIPVPFVRLKNVFQVTGMTQSTSLWDFLHHGREALERLSFCGLIGAGIDHEAAPLLTSAFSAAPQITSILQRICGIFKSFHAIMRRDEIELQTIPLANLLSSLHNMVQEEIDIELQIDALEISVLGQDILLLRALFILVKNAFSHGDATIVKITAQINNDTVKLFVSDNGKGMEDSVRREAFMPFKSYPTQNNGKHVGLPVAKKLLQACQGNIEIEDHREQTTVVITLKIV